MNAGKVGQGRGIVVIPAYNEEETIAEVVRGLAAEGLGVDILVVNDGSSDGTGRILRDLPAAVTVTHPINLGYGAAVQTGMLYAVREGYDFLALMDADGQHVPSQLRLLLDELSKGSDMVIGSRFAGEAEVYAVPFLRRAGIRFFSFLAHLLGGIEVRDVTSGFQAMRRNVFEFLSREYPTHSPDAEVIVMLGRKRFRVTEVPTSVRERQGGTSMYSNVGAAIYYPFKSILSSFIVLLRLMREK
jgi:glycosyltransferase involved in cell wall biosynthesis